jgi:endonuclease YncB( thermonuclease family)
MSKTTFHRIAGALALLHSAPDGDSIRFHPHRTRDLYALGDARSLALAADGGVQLRLEGIDAPELHFRGAAQPYARSARDLLLSLAGVDAVTWHADRKTLRAATPARLAATIVASACDAHGRPIAYLFTGPDADAVPARVYGDERDDAILRRSLNAEMLHAGAAYPLLYDTMPSAHRGLFAAIARRARRAGLGLWPHDRTAHGLPLTAIARTARAPLVWPKLFRRVVDYLAARDGGFLGTIVDWLRDRAHAASRDDRIGLASGETIQLSDALRLRDDHVGLAIDPVDATVETRVAPRPHAMPIAAHA